MAPFDSGLAPVPMHVFALVRQEGGLPRQPAVQLFAISLPIDRRYQLGAVFSVYLNRQKSHQLALPRVNAPNNSFAIDLQVADGCGVEQVFDLVSRRKLLGSFERSAQPVDDQGYREAQNPYYGLEERYMP